MAVAAGYSGTPLVKKLGLKPCMRIALSEVPKDIRAEIADMVADCTMAQRAPLDFILFFTDAQSRLKRDFPKWAKQLEPAGILWVAWPKKSSGVKTDLDENSVRAIGLNAGLVDVKVCAINEIWSGLKFVYRLKDR